MGNLANIIICLIYGITTNKLTLVSHETRKLNPHSQGLPNNSCPDYNLKTTVQATDLI